MATIKEELLLIKVSTIHKNGSDDEGVVTEEIMATLEQVVAELLGDKAVVEVETLADE